MPPKKAITLFPSTGMRPRWCSKSPTMAWTSMPSYSDATASLAFRSVTWSTSKGMNPRRWPAEDMAFSSSRVFSDVPEPSSTNVSAPKAATSPACAERISRSRRVG